MARSPGTAPLIEALRSRFGHEGFRGPQEEIVRALLDGQSLLAVLPTGIGKSLCYQLPALMGDGLTVVVSPLLALMKDQVDALQARGHAAERLDSTRSPAERAEITNRLAAGELRLLYLSPEVFVAATTRKMLRGLALERLVVDEAHCVVEWGHQFRPDYLLVARWGRRLPFKHVAAFTATATPKLAREIRRSFSIPKSAEFRQPAHRPNLALRITPCRTGEKTTRLIRLLRENPGDTLVYTTRRITAEAVTAALRREGIAARAFHAGLPTPVRHEVQDGFQKGAIPVVVATIAFGMGVDKPDIRHVIHYNLPASMEGYAQETGRAGRDGVTATCHCLASHGDLRSLRDLKEAANPPPETLAALLDRILRLGADFEIPLYEWSVANDIEVGAIEALLARLEMDGIARAKGSRPSRFDLRWLRPLESILSGRDKAEVRLLRHIHTACPQSFGWLRLDPESLPAPLRPTPAKLSRLLHSLDSAGDARIRNRRPIHRYQITRPPAEPKEWIRRVVEDMDERHHSALQRISEVERFFSSRSCLARALAAHFGDRNLPSCGNCERCINPTHPRWPTDPAEPITDTHRSTIRALASENHPALSTPLALARFLLGRSSPATRRARLTNHPAFGLLSETGHDSILALTKAILTNVTSRQAR